MFSCNTALSSYQCKNCDFSSYEKIQMTRHICHQNGYKNAVIPQFCRKCYFRTFSIVCLFFHRKKCINRSLAEKWFECEKCSYKSKKHCSLFHHYISKHTSENQVEWFKCDECPYKAKVIHGLTRHQRDQHSHERRWLKCEKCSYKSLRGSNLQRHKICKHTSRELIQWLPCDQCNFKAKTSDVLIRHRKRIHPGASSYDNTNMTINWNFCQLCSLKRIFQQI